MPDGIEVSNALAAGVAPTSRASLSARRQVGGQAGRRDIARWLLAPSLVLLGLFLGLPLVVVLIASFQPNVLITRDSAGVYNYTYLIAQPYYAKILVRTIWLGIVSTVLTLPLGYAAALMLPRLRGRLANVAVMGLTFPILAGPLVVILGWMALLPAHGPLFGPLVRWGLISPPRIIGTDAAVLISLVQFMLPFAILTLYTTIKQIPRELYEAAESLGAGPLREFRDVTLPLSMPGVLSTSIILFSLGASSYISPHYLGGAANLTLTTLIGQFILATYNNALASAAAMLLLVIMVLCMVGLVLLFRPLIRP
ncbi:MAG TPA: ABC transporter permease [Alphaproteobacteria bacterium]|nr:ABC transporter permease [Alphaproteobacteria bacterium]